MTTAADPAERDPGLRWARIATLASLGVAWLASMMMPVIAVLEEQRITWVALGAVGTAVFAVTLAGSLYAVATPWLRDRSRLVLLIAFGGACVLSVPLLAPVGGSDWETWAWVGGAAAGFFPMLLRRPRIVAVALVAVLAVAMLVALVLDGSVWAYLFVTTTVTVGVAGMSGLPVWLWGLLLQARAGRAAQASLAVTEERLRFARDVHDLLGHRLAVIALKAELAARLAPTDAERAASESAEVRRIAAAALTEVREAVHGYRTVDLTGQLTAVTGLLESSGIRCTVTRPTGDLPTDAASQLALLLREASTNVLRHSKATWCTIDISHGDDEVTMTVANDGARGSAPDRHSFGLRGAAERLHDLDGTLHTGEEDGVFTLTATVPTAS